MRKAVLSLARILAAPLIVMALAASPLLVTGGESGLGLSLGPALELMTQWLRGLSDGSSFRYLIGKTEWNLVQSTPRYFLVSLLYLLLPGSLGLAFGTALGLALPGTKGRLLGSALNFFFAVPEFIMALLLQLLSLSVLDLAGIKLASISYDGMGHFLILLPLVLMTFYPFAYSFRLASRKAADAAAADFTSYARSKGLSERTIRLRHIGAAVLPSMRAELPSILAIMQANLFLCEFIFSLPGITRLLFTSGFPGRRPGWFEGYQYRLVVWVLFGVLVLYGLAWLFYSLALSLTRKALTGES
jgi:ABC-type dipeptide/oligopeptide/nickel transport system permease component